MKFRLLFLLLLPVFAQAQPGYTKIYARYNWIAGRFDSGLHVPQYNGVPTDRVGVWSADGAVAVDTSAGYFYWRNNGSWIKAARFSDIGALGWGITGNSGTTAGTNFLGTTDNKDVSIKLNSITSGWWSITGQTSLGYQSILNRSTNSLNNLNTAFGYQALANNIAIDEGDTSWASNNTAIGYQALENGSFALNNVAVGHNVLSNVAFPSGNVGIGSGAMVGNGINGFSQSVAIGQDALVNGGSSSVAVGHSALKANTGGASSVAVGRNSLLLNTTGSNNIAIGLSAMAANVTSSNNTAVGVSALASHKTGSFNTAIGEGSMASDTSGSVNTAVGYHSLYSNTTGEQNAAFGVNALLLNTTGIKNVANGTASLENNTTGGFNTGVGHDALLDNTTGSENIGIGWLGWSQNRTGNYNVGVGNSTGRTVLNGNYNTAIGANAMYNGSQNDTLDNCISIGFGSYTTRNKQFAISDSAASFTFRGVSRGVAGYVLTDSLGNGEYWVARPASGGGGSPAGNYGNLQLNRNGAFAAAGSDSIGFIAATGLTYAYNGAFITGTNGFTLTASGGTGIASALMGGSGINMSSGGVSIPVSGTNIVTILGNGVYVGAPGTPTAILEIKAGTASAGTAPLKFTSGTLNTTPEVGAKEYNNAHYETTNALNRYALGGPIKDFITTVDNGTTVETDLYTYTTKASTLASDGEKLNFEIAGTLNDLTATAQLQFYYGGTNIGNTGALTVSATGGWFAKVLVIRTSSSTARAVVTVNTPGASTALYTTQTDLTGLTFTNTQIIKVTGTAGGASGGTGDISAKLGSIEWKGAANN